MNRQKRKDSIIAAAVTFIVALGLLLWLFFDGLSYDKAQLASASMPEIQEEPELFVEPELVQNLGEPDAMTHDEPAPMLKGEPEQAETDNSKLSVPGKNEKPAPPVEKPVTQTKESPVKATDPPKNDEEKKKVTSKMANKFSSNNGSETGSTGKSGAGGEGSGVAGNVSGRTFKSCPMPSVALKSKVVVVVTVTIDASGSVTKATAKKKSGNVTQDILDACRNAALKAKWSEDKDTPTATGTLTFTIVPK